MTMHAPMLFVRQSSPPIIIPHTIAVSHQLPWTVANASETIRNAFQLFSPTPASLKSAGAMMDRQRKSRQKSSSITGTTSDALAMRIAIQPHMIAGFEKTFVGSNASGDGLNGLYVSPWKLNDIFC